MYLHNSIAYMYLCMYAHQIRAGEITSISQRSHTYCRVDVPRQLASERSRRRRRDSQCSLVREDRLSPSLPPSLLSLPRDAESKPGTRNSLLSFVRHFQRLSG